MADGHEEARRFRITRLRGWPRHSHAPIREPLDDGSQAPQGLQRGMGIADRSRARQLVEKFVRIVQPLPCGPAPGEICWTGLAKHGKHLTHPLLKMSSGIASARWRLGV